MAGTIWTDPVQPMGSTSAIAAAMDRVDAMLEQDRNQSNALKCLKESTADALLAGRPRIEKVHERD